MFKCSFPSALTTVYRTSICMFHMSHTSFVLLLFNYFDKPNKACVSVPGRGV